MKDIGFVPESGNTKTNSIFSSTETQIIVERKNTYNWLYNHIKCVVYLSTITVERTELKLTKRIPSGFSTNKTFFFVFCIETCFFFEHLDWMYCDSLTEEATYFLRKDNNKNVHSILSFASYC